MESDFSLSESQAVLFLQERIADLELALEDRHWLQLTGQADYEFSREGLRRIHEIAQVMYLKNPLIKRGVDVQSYYVFGQGMTLRADDDQVNQVVQKFLNDHHNRAELTTQKAMTAKERELQLSGNIFFVFFVNPATGRVLIRTMPVDEIDDIISNPQDAKDPWLYRRSWVEVRDNNGIEQTLSRTAYYPDWRYQPKARRPEYAGFPVHWNEPVYHLKVGGLSSMKFGVSEVYAAIDWAVAYKSFLEDWATIVRSLSRFAWKLTAVGGQKSIAAAKAKIATTQSTNADETNPPPTTGSVFIQKPGYDLVPIPKSGATVSAEDGRRLMLMVSATMGLPETFFGDVSVGTLATANSLDRPTELKFKDRQSTWSDVFADICQYVVYWAAKAPRGPLAGVVTIQEEEDGTPRLTLPGDQEITIRATFPPILEHDIAQQVSAVTQASETGLIDDETIARMLLTALGEQDVDAALERIASAAEHAAVNATVAAEENKLLEAVRELRQALKEAREI